MQIDSQVASRFEPLLLPRWTEIDGFRGFVTGYGRLLPLRKPSHFGEAAMIRTLLELSGGITGKVTALLARAAEAAILDGSEQIDPSRSSNTTNGYARRPRERYSRALARLSSAAWRRILAFVVRARRGVLRPVPTSHVEHRRARTTQTAALERYL